MSSNDSVLAAFNYGPLHYYTLASVLLNACKCNVGSNGSKHLSILNDYPFMKNKQKTIPKYS